MKTVDKFTKVNEKEKVSNIKRLYVGITKDDEIYSIEVRDKNYFSISGSTDRKITESDAEEQSREMLIDNFEEGQFDPDYLPSNAIDTDWFQDALEESNRFYAEDIYDEGSDDYPNRLAEEMVDRGIVDEEEAKDDEFEAMDYIDDFVEDLSSDYDDPTEWFIDNFGKEEYNRTLVEKNLIDVEAVVDDMDVMEYFDNSTLPEEVVGDDGETYLFEASGGGQNIDELNNLAVSFLPFSLLAQVKRNWSKYHLKELPKKDFFPKVTQDEEAILKYYVNNDLDSYAKGGKIYEITNIKYDTEDDTDLPKKLTITVPSEYEGYEADEYISDKISDETGFTHLGYSTTPEIEYAKGGDVKVGDIVYPDTLSGKWKVIKLLGDKKSNRGITFMGGDYYETQIQSLDTGEIVNYPSNRYAKGGKTQGKIYKIQEKFKYDLQPKWKDEKFQTGGRKFLSYKQAQDFKKKLQRMSSSMQYKVVEDKDFAKGGKIGIDGNTKGAKKYEIFEYSTQSARTPDNEYTINVNDFDKLIKKITKRAKDKKIPHIEVDYGGSYLGSINERRNYRFQIGRGFLDNPLQSKMSYINNQVNRKYRMAKGGEIEDDLKKFQKQAQELEIDKEKGKIDDFTYMVESGKVNRIINYLLDKKSKMAKGGYIPYEDVREFEVYVSEFYGKDGIYKDDYDGGFTKQEIIEAVSDYIKDPRTEWGGGDSFDRELMRDRYLIPSRYPNRKTEFKEKGGKMEKVKVISKVFSSNGNTYNIDEYRELSNEELIGKKQLSLSEAKNLLFKINEDAIDYEDEINELESVDELGDFVYENDLGTIENTYNYSWWGGTRQYIMVHNDGDKYDADYETMVFMSYHRGGDVRGNYEKYEAFEIDGYAYEEFPIFADRLTYTIQKDGKSITADTEDMEGYDLYIQQSDFDEFEEDDTTNLDELGEKLGFKAYEYYEAGGTLPTPFGQAGLVGETGTLNEMELFAMGGTLPQGVHQFYANTYNPAYPTPHGYAKGGEIKEFFNENLELVKNYDNKFKETVYVIRDKKTLKEYVVNNKANIEKNLKARGFSKKEVNKIVNNAKTDKSVKYFAKGGDVKELKQISKELAKSVKAHDRQSKELKKIASNLVEEGKMEKGGGIEDISNELYEKINRIKNWKIIKKDKVNNDRNVFRILSKTKDGKYFKFNHLVNGKELKNPVYFTNFENANKYYNSFFAKGGYVDIIKVTEPRSGKRTEKQVSRKDTYREALKEVDRLNAKNKNPDVKFVTGNIYDKGGKIQGYNDKLDESLGNTKGKRSSKKQNYKDRRDESEAMEKKQGRRKYARVKTMDKGNRKKRKTPMTLAKAIRRDGEKWQDALKRAVAMMKKDA